MVKMPENDTYKSLCWLCITKTHAVKLSGYVMQFCPCDRCGRLADLALCEVEKPEARDT